MDNRINVENVIQESKKKEQLLYIIVSVIGILLPFILWVFYFNSLESESWKNFSTVLTIIFIGFFLMFGIVNLIKVSYREKKFRNALIKYACLIEKVQISETAIITHCLRAGDGRFGFDAINYHFWKEEQEFVFLPVCPTYKTAKTYNLVQAVRLNIPMVRSFYMTGNQYFEVKKERSEEDILENEPSESNSKTPKPVFKDTRATIIAYAVGDQTVYLTFSMNLYERLNKLIPDKNKEVIETIAKQALADSLLPIKGNPSDNQPTDKIAELQILRDNGSITENEFQERKNKLLDEM